MYITSYVDGRKGVDTLDGFSDGALDYIEDIYEYYYEKTGISSNDGTWFGDLKISSNFSEESDSFDAVLSIYYSIDDYYGDNQDFSTYNHYHLTFDLNSDNKFDITERALYENFDKNVDHFDGTSLFFDIGDGDDVTSFNLKTGQYKNETLFQSNLDFYIDEREDDSFLDDYQQTDNYGLIAGINNREKNELIFVENINTENHSVLFEVEYDGSGNSYLDDITENKYGTLNVVAGNSQWTYSEDYKIQTAEENYKLYTYTKNGTKLSVQLDHYIPGSEYNTGSLGHVIGVGIGAALKAKIDKFKKVFNTYLKN